MDQWHAYLTCNLLQRRISLAVAHRGQWGAGLGRLARARLESTCPDRSSQTGVARVARREAGVARRLPRALAGPGALTGETPAAVAVSNCSVRISEALVLGSRAEYIQAFIATLRGGACLTPR